LLDRGNLLRWWLIRKALTLTEESHMGGHPEQAPDSARTYRSPWRVLARAFERSRDLWKAKYKALQERVKAARTERRDLRRSRDRWRAEAEALRREVSRLKDLGRRHLEPSPPAPSRPGRPALTRPSS
jgi:hypothetical protein